MSMFAAWRVIPPTLRAALLDAASIIKPKGHDDDDDDNDDDDGADDDGDDDNDDDNDDDDGT